MLLDSEKLLENCFGLQWVTRTKLNYWTDKLTFLLHEKFALSSDNTLSFF